MDALGLDWAHLVGHFLGGMISADMAATAPGRVARLVLVAPAGLWRDDAPVADFLAMSSAELEQHLWAGGQSPEGADVEASEQAPELLLPERVQDLTAAGKFLWPIPDRGLKRRAYRIKAPTLILWGDQDRFAPPVYARDFRRLIKGSEVEVMPDAGHLLMLEHPDAFAGTVSRFLNG